MDFLYLLNRVEDTTKRNAALLDLESDFNMLLPPILRLFFQLYEGGKYIENHPYKHYNEMSNRTREFCEIIPDKNASFFIYEFMLLNEIRSNMAAVYPNDHPIWHEKLIPIAETSGQGYLLISCKRETFDNVYIDYPGEDEYTFLAKNIFELLMNIKVEFLDKRIENGTVNDLYKKWGEHFWRLSKE